MNTLVVDLQCFMESDNVSMDFPTSLSSFDRKLVHDLAEKYKLTTVSKGEGKNRFITIYKEKFQSKVVYPLTKTMDLYCWSRKRQEWIEVTKSTQVELSKIKVITWNVLFDLYQTDLLCSDERFVECLKLLEDQKADVICLQEVTMTFLKLCLGESWIRERYVISERNGSTLDPYGLIVLSRIPISQVLYFKYSEKTKPILICVGKEWNFVNVHLPSDKHFDHTKQRNSMLMDVYFKTKYYANCILCGDFNFDEKSFDWNGFKDIGQELTNGNGVTFDPVNNPTATITSSKGIPLRLDKVLYKSTSWKPITIERIGMSTFKTKNNTELCPSDHYGLVVAMQKVDF
jgi:endonuclease/exonuclease/phosphatase family metal-dependent hydrolase